MGEARKTAPKNELYDAQARLMSGESLTRAGVASSSSRQNAETRKRAVRLLASEHAGALQEPNPRLREFDGGQCLARTARMMEAKRFAKKTSAAER